MNRKIFDDDGKDLKGAILHHTFAVYDKLEGLSKAEKDELFNKHLLPLVGALSTTELAALYRMAEDEDRVSPRNRKWKNCTKMSHMLDALDAALEDYSGILKEVAEEEEAKYQAEEAAKASKAAREGEQAADKEPQDSEEGDEKKIEGYDGERGAFVDVD